MDNFISLVISNYNEVLRNVKDPMVDTWFLMKSPGPLLCIIGTYLIFVLKVGPKMMEKKPAFQFNTIMILYNTFQVFFSIWLTYLVLEIDMKSYFSFHGYFQHHSLINLENTHSRKISRAAWWYFFAKIIELLDTIFFVLRKKQNQITFLHVYHHTTTVISSWCYLKYLPGEQGAIIGLLNSIVHIFMYSYYLIASLGPKYKKYLWWKKYMTLIQLIQFGLMLIYLILILINDCHTSKVLTYFFIIHITIFMYLFVKFYRQVYRKKII